MSVVDEEQSKVESLVASLIQHTHTHSTPNTENNTQTLLNCFS